MKTSTLSLLAASLVSCVAAEPSKQVWGANELAATSAPNAVNMQSLMAKKLKHHQAKQAAGVFAKDAYPPQEPADCVDGHAGPYACRNIDLKGFLRHQDMGSKVGEGNDVWGWSSGDREFALVGQADGTAFVEVLQDGNLSYLGRLPNQVTKNVIWRDIKVIGDHAYIGSEAPGHGLQVFDLKKILTLDPENPKTFNVNSDLTAHVTSFGSSHNIISNPDTNLIGVVGTSRSGPCKAGLWMFDVSNPSKPKDVGCVSQDGYVHDAQCSIYHGPDKRYTGKEICFNYNEDTLTIVDITNRAMPKQLSRTSYNGASYTHQGWWADANQRYVLLDDELDEEQQSGPASDQHTTTYIVDAVDLTKPVFKGIYKSPVRSIDHNQYVIDGITYQANYGSGLRVVDVSSVAADPTGSKFKELAFFDVYPEDDDQGGTAEFNGAWSVYPWFKSGYKVVSTIERGLFSLKVNTDE